MDLRLRGLALVAALAAATGCATGPKVYVSHDPSANFSGYRGFAFEAVLGTDRPGGTRSLLSQHLMTAARREMEQRGYVYDEAKPDLVLNFYLNTAEKVRVRSTPTAGVGYYRYRRGLYGTWTGYQTTVTQYTEGTLNLDVVEVRRDQLVWEGVAVGRIREKALQNLAESTSKVVAEIFAKYPYTAGAGSP